MKITVDVCVLAVLESTDVFCGADGGDADAEAGGWKPHWRKWISAAVVLVASGAAGEELDSPDDGGTSISLGRGRMNWGFCRAVLAMRLYVSRGIVAQMESGFEAWRSRQRVSISLGGRVEILGISRYEDRGLMPGVDVFFAAAAIGSELDATEGAVDEFSAVG